MFYRRQYNGYHPRLCWEMMTRHNYLQVVNLILHIVSDQSDNEGDNGGDNDNANNSQSENPNDSQPASSPDRKT